jgi:uncharacterized protein YkwD
MAFLVIRGKDEEEFKKLSTFYPGCSSCIFSFISIFSFSRLPFCNRCKSQGNDIQTATSKPQAELNDYENAVACLINDYRVSSGLNAIAYEPTLTYIAQFRSQDLMDRNYWSHYTPEGTTVFNLFKANGVKYKIGGENLGQATPAGIGSPEAFMNAWKNSSSHNANMLRVGYNYIGVGMVENGDRIVVTTVFTN